MNGKSLENLDLQLMSWGDGSGVPTSGNNLVIVGVDNNGLLHIRILDAGGNLITDTNEAKLPSTQAGAISALKQQIPGLLPPHVLTGAEEAQLISQVTSIDNQTRLEGRVRAILAGAPTAEAAAISEIRNYRTSPEECLADIRKVVGEAGSDEDAVFLFAIKRAVFWL
jgi:hypothetical protein